MIIPMTCPLLTEINDQNLLQADDQGQWGFDDHLFNRPPKCNQKKGTLGCSLDFVAQDLQPDI